MTEFGSSDAGKKGGKARAQSLSPERRKEIAQNAVIARWKKAGKEGTKILSASHEGPLHIGDMTIDCAVLEDGTRVLSERAFGNELKLPMGGYQFRQRQEKGHGDLPIFMAYHKLIPFIDNNLMARVKNPLFYKPKTGGAFARGIDAKLIPEVCNVWLKAREAGVLTTKSQQLTASRAEMLVRGLATVGIVALVDEATGYQEDRERRALAKILEAFVAKELRPWVHTFPADYYREMYKLRGLAYPPIRNRMPRYFGVLTNDIVYSRLAPGVLDDLRRKTPRDEKGRLKNHLHRRLTDDVGHPKLLQHLGSVVTLMRMTNDWAGFVELLDKYFPRYAPTPLFDRVEPAKDLSGGDTISSQ